MGVKQIQKRVFSFIHHRREKIIGGRTMKISKGIAHFFNYQKLNVKKKYDQEL